MNDTVIRIILVVAYLLLGTFFMGAIPDTAGRPSLAMLFWWPIIVPILAILKIFDIVFCIGQKIGEKLGESD